MIGFDFYQLKKTEQDFQGYMADMNNTIKDSKDTSTQMRVLNQFCNSKIVYFKFEMTQLKKTLTEETSAEDEFKVIK